VPVIPIIRTSSLYALADELNQVGGWVGLLPTSSTRWVGGWGQRRGVREHGGCGACGEGRVSMASSRPRLRMNAAAHSGWRHSVMVAPPPSQPLPPLLSQWPAERIGQILRIAAGLDYRIQVC